MLGELRDICEKVCKMSEKISYNPFCVDGYLVVPQEKLVRIYNIFNGAPVLKSYVELSAVPQKVNLRNHFKRNVFHILKDSGLYTSEQSLRKSFFTPLKNGVADNQYDSSVLIGLTGAHFVWLLINAKNRQVYGICLEDLTCDNPGQETFQVVNHKKYDGIQSFEKYVQKTSDWKKSFIEFQKNNKTLFGR